MKTLGFVSQLNSPNVVMILSYSDMAYWHLVCLQFIYQIRDVIWIILSEVFLHFNDIIMIQKALSQLTPPVFMHKVSNQHSQSNMIVTLQSHFEFIVRLPTVSRQLKSSSHWEVYSFAYNFLPVHERNLIALQMKGSWHDLTLPNHLMKARSALSLRTEETPAVILQM